MAMSPSEYAQQQWLIAEVARLRAIVEPESVPATDIPARPAPRCNGAAIRPVGSRGFRPAPAGPQKRPRSEKVETPAPKCVRCNDTGWIETRRRNYESDDYSLSRARCDCGVGEVRIVAEKPTTMRCWSNACNPHPWAGCERCQGTGQVRIPALPEGCGVNGQDLECVSCGVRLYGKKLEDVCPYLRGER